MIREYIVVSETCETYPFDMSLDFSPDPNVCYCTQIVRFDRTYKCEIIDTTVEPLFYDHPHSGKDSDKSTTIQARPHSRRSTQNTVSSLVSKNQNPENIVQILTSTRCLPLSPSYYFHFSLYSSRPLESAYFPSPLRATIVYAILKLICYAFVQPCSFGRSQF